MSTRLSTLLLAICLASAAALAQQAPASHEDALDPSPINPATDPNVDMFVNNWKNAKPRPMYGRLIFHDMLTKLEGPDPQHPTRRGAVLVNITAISYTTLDAGVTAAGRAQAGERQVFYTTTGTGEIVVNGKTIEVRKGIGFTLTPDFDFKLTNKGKSTLAFYVRTEPVPAGTPASPDLVVTNRFEADRRVGAHWAHINNGGPNGMSLITISPRTMPQPHSHPAEECWLAVEGDSILSLGKTIRKMTPGTAYKIPPTGVTAHSNFNLNEEPVELIFMGPAGQGGGRGRGGAPARDYSRLDNSPYNRGAEQDIDMFMGNWHDSFPRILHGNLYVRDMLTASKGSDPLHPSRRGAVLTNAEAVSFAQLEPGASAHPVEGELKGIQQTLVVNSGTGVITSGGRKFDLAKDMAFILTPGLDFKLTAAGDHYMSFYVVSEKLPAGFTPKSTLEVIDNRTKPQTTSAWVNKERPIIAKENGLSQYNALTRVEMGPMTMSRPTSAAPGVEEIWIATDGDVDILLGKEMRKLPAGTAYRVPPTGITAHANINITSGTARFISLVK